jgi:hypothetical protein
MALLSQSNPPRELEKKEEEKTNDQPLLTHF